jgi:hypothetical protein
MSLLSFSLNREAIESGSKPHTIRFRKIPPRQGEDLYLWWKSRTADRDLIGVSNCERVDQISIDGTARSVRLGGKKLTQASVKKLALKDGFVSVDKFWEFFPGSRDGFLIWWNPDHITQRRILPRVRVQGECNSEIVAQPIERYYSSNGTEGMMWAENWCDLCRRRETCFVMLKALAEGSTRHWISHEGQPICTVFEPKHRTESSKFAGHQNRLEAGGQLRLFG